MHSNDPYALRSLAWSARLGRSTRDYYLVIACTTTSRIVVPHRFAVISLFPISLTILLFLSVIVFNLASSGPKVLVFGIRILAGPAPDG